MSSSEQLGVCVLLGLELEKRHSGPTLWTNTHSAVHKNTVLNVAFGFIELFVYVCEKGSACGHAGMRLVLYFDISIKLITVLL